jgi:hypothetical protein
MADIMHNAVPFLFTAGFILVNVCGFRLMVRMLRLFGPESSWDRATKWFLTIRLRDTFLLELLGFVIAVVMVLVAILIRESK